ncbi:MAG: hypothetical protein RSA12_10130 [Clostridia bacterium]
MKKMQMAVCLMGVMLLMSHASAQTFEAVYQSGKVNIVFRANVETDRPLPTKVYRARAQQWDEQKLRDAFLGGEAVDLTARNEPTDEGRFYYRQDARGMTLLALKGMVDFEDNFFAYVTIEQMCALVRETPPDAPKAIAGLTKEQAIARLKSIADKLGLELGEVFQATPMTHALFQRVYRDYYDGLDPSEYRYHQPPEQQAQLPDGYWMRADLCVDGVPIMRECYQIGNTEQVVDVSRLLAYVTVNGVDCFITDGKVYECVDQKEIEAPIRSFDEAVQLFLKRCDGLILKEDVEVVRIAINYVPVPRKDRAYVLRPAWCFYLTGPGATFDNYGENTPVYFDAITGKQLT